MHQEVMMATMATMGPTCYVGFNCDEIFIMDN
jgi:hypothetical protein